MCSIWLVVLVAANRYWAVCRPHASARVWTTRRTVGYVAAVVLSVIAFNVPRMIEYRIDTVPISTSVSVISTTTTLPANVTIDHYLYNSTTHIETESNENETTAGVEWKLREVRTAFGRSAFYRYVYKVLFVNILLVLLPIITLIVMSVFVIRALRQTPSYRLSLLHTKPRLPEAQAPAAAVEAQAAGAGDTSTEEIIKDDDDNNPDQQQQQQQQLQLIKMTRINGETPDNIREVCDSDDNAGKSRPVFSLKSLKVRCMISSVYSQN